jgi:flavodoxin
MKKAVFLTLLFVFWGNMELYAQNQKDKILIVYYSKTGNTKTVAEYIHKTVGGDIFEIKTVNSYPEEYQATTELAKKEQETNARPKLVSNVDNIEQYNTIFIGYPNWWGTMPMVFFTFFESHNLTQKTIIPFCTHEGSGMGRSVADIQKLAPKSTVKDGLAIRGRNAKDSQNDINLWLRRIGMVK